MANLTRILFCLYLLIVSQSCQQDCRGCFPDEIPLSSNLVGRWQWVKTVTPTQTLTPESTKYTQEFNHFNDSVTGSYLTFYRNDTLQSKLFVYNNFFEQNKEQNTVLLSVTGNKYIKFFLTKDKQNFFGEVTLSLPPIMSQF